MLLRLLGYKELEEFTFRGDQWEDVRRYDILVPQRGTRNSYPFVAVGNAVQDNRMYLTGYSLGHWTYEGEPPIALYGTIPSRYRWYRRPARFRGFITCLVYPIWTIWRLFWFTS